MTRTEHLLTIAAEECAEVAQRCSKAMRFGLNETQPGHDLNNQERIIAEFADLIAVMEMVGIPLTRISRLAIDAKQQKVEQYLAYSAQLGTLQEKVPQPRLQTPSRHPA